MLPGKGEKFVENFMLNLPTDTDLNIYFRNSILQLYINKYGEYEGIHHFYTNYKCLKILDTWSESLDFLKTYTNDDKEGNN